MRNKTIFITILFCILFSISSYACEDIFYTATKNVASIEEKQNIIKIMKIALFNENISDTIEPKVLYTQNNSLKALLFKYTGSNYPKNLLLEINENKYTITSTPDENGYVYFYFPENTDTVISPSSIIFINDEERSQKFTVKPTEIVSQNEDWTTSDDGHTLYKYIGSDTCPTVPNFYKGNIITTVGGYENENILGNKKTGVTGVNISDGIQKIGNYAFYQISSLTTATLPDSIEIIGGASFKDTSLTGELNIPKNTVEIYPYAFDNTNITALKLNNGLKRIDSYAFSDCSALGGTLTLPDTLNYLEDAAFYQCSNLTGDLTIPAGVTKIGNGVFFNCSGFDGCLTLENGVKETGTLAFASSIPKTPMCFNKLVLPNSLTKIGPYTFQYCTKIPELTLNEGLEVISDGAFDHMTGLENTSLTIPSTVKTIGGDYLVNENTGYGGHVFYDMGKTSKFKAIYTASGNKYFTSLDCILYSYDRTRILAYPRGKRDTIFEIPEGVTQIDEMAFSRASYLKKVILPDSYTISTDLPENILNRDYANSLSGAFYLYTGINSVSVKSSNTKYTSVDGILYSKDMKTLWYVPNKYKGTVNIANGVEKTEKGSMFISNKGNTLWTNIVFPASMVWIHNDTIDVCNEYFKNLVTIDHSLYYNIEDGAIVEKPYKLGDLNSDGVIDNKDTAIILKYINNNMLFNFNKKTADVNKDQKVDLLDAIIILKGEIQ